MMNTTGKRTALCLLFLTMVTLWWGYSFDQPAHAQDMASLEAECVVLVSANSSIAPTSVSAQELCKVGVALLGNEWMKAIKLEATILAVNELNDRLVIAEAEIAALKAQSPAAFQTQIDTMQSQLNGIDLKLTNVATALQ